MLTSIDRWRARWASLSTEHPGDWSPGTDDWLIWGMAFAPLGVAALGLVVGTSFELAGEVLDVLSSVVLMLCSIGIVTIAGIVFSRKDKPGTIDKLALAATILVLAGAVINPPKYAEILGAIVGGLDWWGGVGAAATVFAATGLTWDDPVG